MQRKQTFHQCDPIEKPYLIVDKEFNLKLRRDEEQIWVIFLILI